MMISVIIPFFLNVNTLELVLEGLNKQTFPTENFEVIIVNDGSKESLTKLDSINWLFRLIIFFQTNQGPAAARNHGSRHAEGKILLFLDSDIIPDQDMLEVHYSAHKLLDNSLLCGTVNPYKIPSNTIIDVLFDGEEDGRLSYAPAGVTHIFRIPFYDVASNHFSIKKVDFDKLQGFDERFRACEDVEFAYRAYLSGMSILLIKDAVGHHNHSRNLDQRLTRNRKYASYRPLIMQKNPDIAERIPSWRVELPVRISDDIFLLVKKLKLRFFAFYPIRNSLLWLARFLEYHHIQTRLLLFIYWRLIAVYEYLGIKDGQKKIT